MIINNIELIILLIIILGIIPVIRINSYYLYILQLKEYRYDRLKEFFFTKQGIKTVFNKLYLIYFFIILLYLISYFFYDNNFFNYISIILIIFLGFDNLICFGKFYNKSFVVPEKTTRMFYITIILGLIQLGILAIGYIIKHFFVGIFILLLFSPVLIIISNLMLLPIINYKKKSLMTRAKIKMGNMSIKKIGITGSYGKSTMKLFISKLLEQEKKVFKTPKNINTELGVSNLIINKLEKNKYDYFVCEMGAYRIGEISLLGKIVGHKYGFLTGIGDQHLGLFGSQENIINAKWEILESVIKNKGKLYVNLDSENLGKNIDIYKDFICTYSMKNKNADAYCNIIEDGIGYTIFDFEYKNINQEFKTNLLGKHNILNITGTICFAIDQGISMQNIKRALLKFDLPGSTGTIHKLKSGITIIDDSYNLSQEGLFSGIDLLSKFTTPHILVLDDIIELGANSKSVHRKIGQKLANFDVDKIFLVGNNYSKFIYKGLKDQGFDEKKIYFKGDINILKMITNGTVLLEGRGTSKIFTN